MQKEELDNELKRRLKNYIVTCEHCGKAIGKLNFKTCAKAYKEYDSKGKSKLFCNEDCFTEYIEQYCVEVYKGYPIYMIEKNGRNVYILSWDFVYYYPTIEDCRIVIEDYDRIYKKAKLRGKL